MSTHRFHWLRSVVGLSSYYLWPIYRPFISSHILTVSLMMNGSMMTYDKVTQREVMAPGQGRKDRRGEESDHDDDERGDTLSFPEQYMSKGFELVDANSLASPSPLRVNRDDEGQPLLEQKEEVVARKRFMSAGSMTGSVFTLSNSSLGCGILSLPYAFRLSGFGLGMMMLIAAALLTIYSVHLLVRCREVTFLSTYEELATLCFGKPLSRLVDTSIVLFCFGCSVAYVVATHDILAPILVDFFPKHPWAHQKALIMISSGVFILFPLSLVEKLSSLRFTSLVGVMAICYLVMAIVIDSSMELYRRGTPSLGVYFFRPGWNAFRSLAMMMFAFTCQVNVFSIYSDLQRPNSRRMGKIVRRSTTMTAVLYAVVGVFAFWKHLDATSPDVLADYRLKANPIMGIANIVMGISLALAFPFNIHPARETIDMALFPRSLPCKIRLYALTMLIVFSAVAVAVVAPSIDRVFGLIGSTTSAVVAFILPGLFYLQIFPGQWHQGGDGLGALLLVVVGAFLGVVGTVVELGNIFG